MNKLVTKVFLFSVDIDIKNTLLYCCVVYVKYNMLTPTALGHNKRNYMK